MKNCRIRSISRAGLNLARYRDEIIRHASRAKVVREQLLVQLLRSGISMGALQDSATSPWFIVHMATRHARV